MLQPPGGVLGMRCSICHDPVPPRPENRAFPFCSDRCKYVDLGRWLKEDYVISEPVADAEADSAETLELGDPPPTVH